MRSCRTASWRSFSASRSRRGPRPRSTTPHIDLHCHSTASDGECEPSEVARHARAAGLSAIALTDHDTTDGIADATHEAAKLGVRIIPGCEFSVRAPWGELHVLALFLPYANERLQGFLRDTRAARRRRGEQMVTKLQSLGVAIELEDVQAQLIGGDGALGRPHVARALVDCGACEDISDAFRRYIGRGRAAYVEKPLPRLSEVTDLVHEVGGITVAAHLGDHGTEAQIRTFQDQGLDCVEVRHPSHQPAVEQRLLKIAERLGMGVSGGSDWHGESEYGGNHAPLGSMQVPYTWLEPLERRAETATMKRGQPT
ncbi:MAG TPA: PHP domain-containing protein [Gemmatimonadales bacterium]|nr:PHP domain-containing protein [Gemmatimonadales bacterium]